MHKYLSFVPFLMMVNGGPKLSGARIVEAVIIAIIAGGFAGFVSFKQLEVKVDNIKYQNESAIHRVESSLSKLDDKMTLIQGELLDHALQTGQAEKTMNQLFRERSSHAH